MSATLNHVLSPIIKYLDPAKYIELKANTFGQIHLETMEGGWRTVDVPELTEQQWWRIGNALSKVTGQRFDRRMPTIRGILPGGHRLFMLMGTDVQDQKTGNKGITAAIRLRSNRTFSFEDFGLDDEGIKICTEAIEERHTIAIAGGTGSGKTSVARLFCAKMPDAAPISVEDTPELDLQQPIASSLLLSPDSADTEITFKHILDGITRLRPDRAIIGELTVDNCRLLMRMLNIGNDGGLFTVHSDSPEDTVPAIVELFQLASYSSDAASDYLTRKIGLVVYCKRGGNRRFVDELYRPSKAGGEVLWTAF